METFVNAIKFPGSISEYSWTSRNTKIGFLCPPFEAIKILSENE
jgi:hypothetical protein